MTAIERRRFVRLASSLRRQTRLGATPDGDSLITAIEQYAAKTANDSVYAFAMSLRYRSRLRLCWRWFMVRWDRFCNGARA